MKARLPFQIWVLRFIFLAVIENPCHGPRTERIRSSFRIFKKKKVVTYELFFLNASTFTATVVLYFLCAIVKLQSFYDQPNWSTSFFIDFLISLHKHTIDVRFSRNK